jgi:hypothetical protein
MHSTQYFKQVLQIKKEQITVFYLKLTVCQRVSGLADFF